jgi:hypothetical protein
VARKLLVVAVLVAALALAPAAAANPTTRRGAELRVLGATKLFARWHLAAVDARTRTLRPNTTVRCTGRGRASSTRGGTVYPAYLCVLRYRTTRATILYTVGRGRSFNLHLLSRSPRTSGVRR